VLGCAPLISIDDAFFHDEKDFFSLTDILRGVAGDGDDVRELTGVQRADLVLQAKELGVGDDVAVLYNDWSMRAAAPDGTPIELAGKATEIVRRQRDGAWRFAFDDPFSRG